MSSIDIGAELKKAMALCAVCTSGAVAVALGVAVRAGIPDFVPRADLTSVPSDQDIGTAHESDA